ncbi:MAG: SurA N-terminal domain-containing protein, partial [Pseudomonadota bacterium]
MLQGIRDRSRGWVAWFIVLLIAFIFAIWGLDNFLDRGDRKAVAKVNQHTITSAEFERAYDRAARIRSPATDIEAR